MLCILDKVCCYGQPLQNYRFYIAAYCYSVKFSNQATTHTNGGINYGFLLIIVEMKFLNVASSLSRTLKLLILGISEEVFPIKISVVFLY
jgi:hypothetical protein